MSSDKLVLNNVIYLTRPLISEIVYSPKLNILESFEIRTTCEEVQVLSPRSYEKKIIFWIN
jgi:hypothetical protein